MTTSAKPRSFSNRPNAGTHKHPVSPVLARTSALLPALLLLTGCGKEVGRVPFSSEGSHSASLALSA
ncbi:MAG TPA: hypothetical protein VNW92_18865, partial [Polyangiaceae bacterium]|nr:hypothetical protein [Polyangiaceae bacterium]